LGNLGRRAAAARSGVLKDPMAIEVVDRVAVLAERTQHHPDIDIRWNKVTLTLSTHSAGGLTAADFALARRVSALSR